MTKIGIIGGSGLDNPDILEHPLDQALTTRWGAPSTHLKHGKIAGVDVVLLGRHGREHTITPTHVNYRANVQALKDSGCTHILATTAVGSLRENIGRGDLVILDQFIDFTKQRAMSFHETFAPHQPVHTPMADPFDKQLRAILIDLCNQRAQRFHDCGTVVTIEGPRFSTRAESRMFRAWGADVINMSVATEVALANEAGIPYAAVAMSTDYDCWKTDEEPVSWDAILNVFNNNAKKVTSLLVEAIPLIARGGREKAQSTAN
jgi:5'-methylthioadenosine phosphorylase